MFLFFFLRCRSYRHCVQYARFDNNSSTLCVCSYVVIYASCFAFLAVDMRLADAYYFKDYQNQWLWFAILFYELRIPACCVFAIFGCETSETTQARTSSCSVTCSNCHQYLLHRHCSSHLQRGKQWLHMKSGTSFGATSQMHWASWKNFSETCPRQRKRRLPILTNSNAATATK